MSLEDIEKELYGQKTSEEEKTARVVPATENANSEGGGIKKPLNPWRNEEMMSHTPEPVQKIQKVGSRIFIGLAIVLVILVGFAGYYLYQYFTTKDAQFVINAPSEVKIGEPFALQVIFQNVSKKSLYEPVISIQLPDGATYLDNSSRKIIEESIPDSMPGDSIKREYSIVLLGTSYQTYRFEGQISYKYGASSLSSKFQKGASAATVARDPVLTLDTTIPSSVMNGQDFEMQVRYKNETDKALKHISIQFDLPENFSINNSDPKLEQNLVNIDTLDPQEEGSIILSGFLTSSSNTYTPFGIKAFLLVADKQYEITSKNSSIAVAPSPLDVLMTSNQEGDVAYPGKNIKFTLRVTNNASVPLQEVVANTKFIGDYFSLATLQGDGSLNDAERTYSWNAARVAALRELQPGQSITIPFSMSLKEGYAPRGVALKDTELEILTKAVSRTVPPGLTAQQTIGMHTYTLKVGGNLSVDQFIYHAEPGGEVQNSGPMPPRVGQETTFTIHWNARAQGSDIEQVRIRASLGSSMQWTGKMSVKNSADVPKFNPQTQEITWDLARVEAGNGSQNPEAIFQILFSPGSNMTGMQYVFLENISFTGKDAFTGKEVSGSFEVLDSRDIADANALPLEYDKVKL